MRGQTEGGGHLQQKIVFTPPTIVLPSRNKKRDDSQCVSASVSKGLAFNTSSSVTLLLLRRRVGEAGEEDGDDDDDDDCFV